MNFTYKLIFTLSAILISQSEVFGRGFGGKDGRGPPGRRHHGPPSLPFLRGLNRSDVKEFLEIRRNDNLTKAQVQVQEDAWADKQNATVKSVYDEFKVNRTKFDMEFKANITKAAANLTADAKAIFDQIEKVKENQNISYRQEHQQIRAILDGTTQEIRDELKKTLPRPPRGRHGRGGRHGPGGRWGPGGRGGPVVPDVPVETGGPSDQDNEMASPIDGSMEAFDDSQ